MAKTLFFIEALAFTALSVIFPMIASETAAAFFFPFALSLVLPIACVSATWPIRSVVRSVRAAFAPKSPGPEAESAARILSSLCDFSRLASILGFLFALFAVFARGPFPNGPRTWILLGVFLSAYALVNAMLWRILAQAVAERRALETAPDPGREGAGFAAAYGLTPREAETAAWISMGRSYKETAYGLGISIRTVKAHMGRVYEKTGAASNVALALKMRGEDGR
jgi:DNA-binding CsgD family transcriptional regulator